MDLRKIAENAADEAMIVAKRFMTDSQVISSEKKDIKTRADLEVNSCVIDHLRPTGIPIISEENEHQSDIIPKRCWIIDPIDGTLNFDRKFPCAGISICLWEKNSPVIGIVKEIFNGLTFSSSLNMGATTGDSKIMVSDVSLVKNAVLTTGFPSGGSYKTEDLFSFVKKVQDFKKIRAIGSASVMLSYVARGIFDAYYENNIYIWDVAAGLCLVREAGGKIFFRKNDGNHKYEVLATNAKIFDEAKSLLLH